ncbi:MAG: hypothetical protein KatS3mg121_0032 [Gammaproteobacteria bacterium]|nr:MAG: hypothetical protein KatS3mg121_0032 [Gammaproteobacteria bacterium]
MIGSSTAAEDRARRLAEWYRRRAPRLRRCAAAALRRALGEWPLHEAVVLGLGSEWLERRAAPLLLDLHDWGLDAAHLPLPLDSGGCDGVVLLHALDLAADPHGLLREAGRVLRPGGYLIALGFNPFSPYGAWRLLRRAAGRPGPPWNLGFLAPLRINDWLRLLGFTPLCVRGAHGLAGGAALLDNVYLLVAHKRPEALTPLRPARRRLRAVPLAVRPTAHRAA